MADLPALTPRDYDPWHLATHLQLLTLLDRLGVPMIEVARSLHVPRSNISMWRRGTRPFPPKHLDALRAYTRRTFDAAADLTDKAASLAPTAELREAIRAEFGALWGRWQQEVLYDAGTFRRAKIRQYEALGPLLHKEHPTAEDRETMALMMEALLRYVDLERQQQGAVPSAEEELITRLTASHGEATRTQGEGTDHGVR
jgi:hypothetical protein